ncbi:MAG: hypothetical protein JO166_16605, partial [Deltaproteobacteria bacterium]|nr:hypothetical protein [Deltaproteobacteria bacterium]
MEIVKGGRLLDSLLWRYRLARGLEPYWDVLDRCAQDSPEAAKAQLATRMREQIRYFGNRPDALPEWREAARAKDKLEVWRLWPQLPILSKRDLRERYSPERIQKDYRVEGERSATGGSTGEPTPYLHDPQMLRAVTAAVFYTRLR